jgi:Tol biopolymer transport system component
LPRRFLIIGVVVCLAAAAPASPITPTPEEEAARTALGDRLPNARLLWVSGGKIYFSPVKDFSPQLVTQGAIPEGNPRWSPDGTRILYVKDPMGVWIMDADFSNRVEVVPDGHTASWTRDGQSITAVKASNPHQVIRYDLSGGNPTTIYDSQDSGYSGGFGYGNELSQAAELRSGGRFLLTFSVDNDHNTYIVDLQNQQYIYNSEMDRGDCSPSWSPDGSYTTTTARTSDRPVLKTDFDPSGPSVGSSNHFVGIGTVCNCAYYVHDHRVSNDGQWLVMGGLNRDENNREIYIWKIGDPESEVVRMTFETAEDNSPSLYVGQPDDGDGQTDSGDSGVWVDGEDGGSNPDAGTDKGTDAGTDADAGTDTDTTGGDEGMVKGSCACGTGSPGCVCMVLLVLIVWRRRGLHA